MADDTRTASSPTPRPTPRGTESNPRDAPKQGFFSRLMAAVKSPLRRKQRKKKGNPNIYPLY